MTVGEFLGKALEGHGFRCAGFNSLFLGEFLKVAAHIVPIFVLPAVGAEAVAEIIGTVKMPLADIRATEAVVVQALTDGFDIVAERHAICPRTVPCGEGSGKQTCACRAANRLGSVGTFKADAVRRKGVEIRGGKSCFAIAVDHIPTLGIGHDKYHLFFLWHG